ncbi:tRNA (adenosine(37)-N6)-threonylcarbamoyltransferase complex dimerization subunit type 1 TsaB [Pelagibaculum spongiae]|nr:tRNA (adenosine(37)-N6)-threonylcarbamoyltransferase complex dimerization subunit type 1 TsaB [Pelagibaculum spongiae]
MTVSKLVNGPILALECCTDACSVALQVDGKIYSRFQVVPRSHSKVMLEMVDQVIAEAAIDKKDLKALAVTAGPGAFTGVRLGVSFAQGIAFGLDIPVYAVNTLDVIAQGAYVENPQVKSILSVLDARMGEVYLAGYQIQNGQLQLEVQSGVFKPEALPNLDVVSQALVCGTGWNVCKQALPKDVTSETENRLPSAVDIFPLLDNTQPMSAADLLPVYLRNEVTWKKLDQQ